MKRKSNKALSLLLTLAMVLGMFPIMTLSASAAVGAHSYTNSSGDVFLGGQYIELGIAKTSSFGTRAGANSSFHPIYGSNGSSGQIGMHRDQDGFETGRTPNTGDFFLPGSPEERYIVGYTIGGTQYSNNNAERYGAS